MVATRIQATINQKEYKILLDIMQELKTSNTSLGIREIFGRYENYSRIQNHYSTTMKQIHEVIYGRQNQTQKITRIKEIIPK